MRGKTNLPTTVVTIEKPNTTPIIGIDLHWTPSVINTTDDFVKVIYAMGYFIALTSAGKIAYSLDGKVWNVKVIGSFTSTDIIYANDMLVIVGYTSTSKGVIATSMDLITWNVTTNMLITGKTVTAFSGIAHNGEHFIICAYTSNVNGICYFSFLYGIDLLNLTLGSQEFNLNSSDISPRVVSGNGRIIVQLQYIGLHDYTQWVVTTDGITFTKLSNTYRKGNIIFCNGYFVSSIYIGTTYYTTISLNGTDWTNIIDNRIVSSLVQYAGCITINDAYLIMKSTGEFYLMSDVVDYWGTTSLPYAISTPMCTFASIANNEEIIVAVGTGGIIFTAALVTDNNTLAVLPDTVDRDIPIYTKDSIRMIKLKAVTKSIDENILAGNIKNGIEILGVVGTYTGA
jgi:hypothetical protein